MQPEFYIEVLDKLFPDPKCPLNYNKDYELLIAVMLSAQCTDERVNQVTKTLFKYSLKELAEMDTSEIENIIKPVGTQKRKSEYVKNIAQKLIEFANGKVPYDRTFVESLPGVGHKTCNVVFSEIYLEPNLAVDTHVTRVAKRLGLALDTDDVLKIEKKLCRFFPKNSWRKVHIQLVLFGRHICKASKPSCNSCPFSEVCSYYKKIKGTFK